MRLSIGNRGARDFSRKSSCVFNEPRSSCGTRRAAGTQKRRLRMKRLDLNLPTFGFIVSTRAALGVGIGLLLSSKIPESRRRTVGLTLVGVGAATTIPALVLAFRGMHG